MKSLIASVVSLILGLVIGWYIEHRRAEHERTEIVQQMVQGMESSDAAEVARDVRAIGFIDAGDTQQAVRLLSSPVADYYSLYTPAATNDQRSKVRALIEQLARTNQAVAARIVEASTNYQLGLFTLFPFTRDDVFLARPRRFPHFDRLLRRNRSTSQLAHVPAAPVDTPRKHQGGTM